MKDRRSLRIFFSTSLFSFQDKNFKKKRQVRCDGLYRILWLSQK